MREIKFRAWVGDRSLLTKVISYVKHKNGFSISYNDSKGNELALMYSKPHAIKLMQFTGLLDKNGVEIYEGDILQDTRRLDSDNNIWLGVMKWYAGGFKLCYKRYVNDKIIIGSNCCEEQTSQWIVEHCEVIGNICENKELLDDK